MPVCCATDKECIGGRVMRCAIRAYLPAHSGKAAGQHSTAADLSDFSPLIISRMPGSTRPASTADAERPDLRKDIKKYT